MSGPSLPQKNPKKDFFNDDDDDDDDDDELFLCNGLPTKDVKP